MVAIEEMIKEKITWGRFAWRLNFRFLTLNIKKILIKSEKFEIGMGPPPLFRALLANENEMGMWSAHRRVARRLKFAPMGTRWRHLLGKADKSTKYCDLCVIFLNIEN